MIWQLKALHRSIRRWLQQANAVKQVSKYQSPADVAEWCAREFWENPHKKLHQFQRIERRLGRIPLMFRGKVELTEARDVLPRPLGGYLFGFKRRPR